MDVSSNNTETNAILKNLAVIMILNEFLDLLVAHIQTLYMYLNSQIMLNMSTVQNSSHGFLSHTN
jgi:hypothetical protein